MDLLTTTGTRSGSHVDVDVDSAILDGVLTLPKNAHGIVLFAHGSGSSRHSRRNRHVANQLNERGLGTLLFDLLTRAEEAVDTRTRELRFDIQLLAQRIAGAARWLDTRSDCRGHKLGIFGASTGAGAALLAAAESPGRFSAVVSRGGRPDLALPVLSQVRAPTLLIVGELDAAVLDLNSRAYRDLACDKAFEVVPGASHLFEEHGKLDEVARLARDWFARHLR